MTARKAGPRILVVGGEPGGARTVAPVADELRRRGACVRMIAAEQAAVMLRSGESSIDVEALPGHLPLHAAAAIVAEFSPDAVLTGFTGSEPIEHAFREAARAVGVPTVAVLDYWDNYRDRIGWKVDGERRESFPDIACSLDTESRRGLIEAGLDPDAVRITGSPAVEAGILRIAELRGSRDSLRSEYRVGPEDLAFTFVSQPFYVMPDGRKTYASWLFDESGSPALGYTPPTVLRGALERLEALAARSGRRCRLLVKPHPREYAPMLRDVVSAFHGEAVLPAVLDGGDVRELIALSDAVFSMSSVALLEAGLSGVPSVSVQPGLLDSGGRDYCRAVLLGVASAAYEWRTFHRIASGLLSGTYQLPEPDPSRLPVTTGCTLAVADIVIAAAEGRQPVSCA